MEFMDNDILSKLSEPLKNWDFYVNQIVISKSNLCKGVSEYYSKDDVNMRSDTRTLASATEENPIIIMGFCENRWIWFNYKLAEGEDCEMYISGVNVSYYKNDKKNKIRTFRWKTGKYANRFTGFLEITKDGEDEQRRYYFQIDVLTQLQDGDNNEANFHNMMNEIREFAYRIFNPSKITTSEEEFIKSIPIEEFFYILENDIIKEAELATYKISLNPYGEYIQEKRRDVLKIADNSAILNMLSNKCCMIDVRSSCISKEVQDIFIENGVNYVSDYIVLPRPRITYNVPENQLIITLFTKIVLCANYMERVWEDQKKILQKQKRYLQKINIDQSEREKLMTKDKQIKLLDEYIRKCREYRRRVQNMSMYPFLQDVQEAKDLSRRTSILQKDKNYNKIYRILKEFMIMPKFLFSNSLGLNILDTPTSYEYWSVIRYVDIVSNKLQGDWKPIENNMIKDCKHGYVVDFPSGKLLEFTKKLTNANIRICLYYHESYDKFTGEYFNTDIALDGIINKCLYETVIFDAKYTTRLDSGGKNNPRSAINVIHAMRDGIIGHHDKYKSIIESGDQIVKQAYALFLGNSNVKPLPNDPENKAGGVKLYPRKENTDIDEINEIIQNFIDRLLIKANKMTDTTNDIRIRSK